MSLSIALTNQEALFLCDLVDAWEEGLQSAIDEHIKDGTLEMDELLEATSQNIEAQRVCQVLRAKFSPVEVT